MFAAAIDEDRIKVYGSAFNRLTMPADAEKGLKTDNRFMVTDPSFGIATSDIQ